MTTQKEENEYLANFNSDESNEGLVELTEVVDKWVEGDL